jgi:hypothetical protein
MVVIQIGTSQRDLSSVSDHWIDQQISRRRMDGNHAQVRVTIRISDLNMTLATPGTPGFQRPTRDPNRHEQEIYDLWDNCGLNNVVFLSANLIKFLNYIKKL